ncbi:MAG: TIM barrel protein [Chloroflexota bacterium]
MELRLGINTCFAVKRWPRPDDWAPIVRDRLGLGLVQHSLDLVDLTGPFESQAAAVTAAATAAGLEVASTFTGLAAYSSNFLLAPDAETRAAAEAWYRAAIRLTALVGATATGGHVGAFSVPDWLDPAARAARWRDLRAALDRLAAAAAESGLDMLVVENLAAAREPSTMAMIEELLSDGDADHVPVRLCLDVGHMCVPGTSGDDRDPYAWLRRFGRQAPIVQLQQSDDAGDHHWPFTPERDRIGRIEPQRVLDALEASGGAACDLILEIIPPFEQADDAVLGDLELSVERWRRALDGR